MSIIPQSFFIGVAMALFFGIIVALPPFVHWPLKLRHRKRKK